MSWLILEMQTGCMDGYYTNKNDALEVLEHFRGEYPKGLWALFSLDKKSVKDSAAIQDSKFIARDANKALLVEKCK